MSFYSFRYPCLKPEADFESHNNFLRVFSNFFHTPNWTDKGSWVDLEKMARGEFGYYAFLGRCPKDRLPASDDVGESPRVTM